LVDDPSIRVRYQLAFSLGEWNDPQAGRALAQVALERPRRRVRADGGAQFRDGSRCVNSGHNSRQTRVDPPPDLFAPVACLLRARRGDGGKALARLGRPAGDNYAAWQLAPRRRPLDAFEHAAACRRRISAVEGSSRKIDRLVDYARKDNGSPTASEADRLLAIRLLGPRPGSAAGGCRASGGNLRPQYSVSLQQAAWSA